MQIFQHRNPIAVTVWFFAVSGVAMFCANPVLQTIALVGGVLLCIAEGSGRSIRTHLFPLGLFAVMSLINPLVSHNGETVLFVMNDNPVTLEAFIYGIFSAVTVVSAIYFFRTFSRIMTSEKLLYIFGAMSPKLSLVLSMALRYVPLFGRQWRKTNSAQKAMGLYREDSLPDSFMGGMRVFSVMVTWALENGIITADSMSARGYGICRRSHFSIFRFTWRDAVFLAVTLSLSIITVLGMRHARYEFYPRFVPPSMTVHALCSYAAYGILAALPIISAVKEDLRWRYLRSKI